jgi:hypothetical protein
LDKCQIYSQAAKKFESRQDLAAPRLFTASLNFKTWNGFHDLLIKISNVITAGIIRANGKPSGRIRPPNRAALSLNAGCR